MLRGVALELAVALDGNEDGAHLVALGRLPAAVHLEAQALRHRAHHQLMQAFLEPEIFDGAVTLRRATPNRGENQLRLMGDRH